MWESGKGKVGREKLNGLMSTAFDWTNSQMAARFAFPFLCLVFLCFSVLLILFVLSLELFSLSRFFIRWLLSDRSLRSAILSRSPLHPSLGSSLFAARPGSSLFAVACPSPHVAGCWSFDSIIFFNMFHTDLRPMAMLQ